MKAICSDRHCPSQSFAFEKETLARGIAAQAGCLKAWHKSACGPAGHRHHFVSNNGLALRFMMPKSMATLNGFQIVKDC